MSKKLEESAHQTICNYIKIMYPDVIFTSDGSGLKLPMGLAVKYAKQKSGRGIPDIIIMQPRGQYHGLMIEVKKDGARVWLKDGTLSTDKHIREQAAVLDRLNRVGYMAVFCIGAKHGIDIVEEYMKNDYI